MITKMENSLELNVNKNLSYGYYNSPIGLIEITASEEAITSVIFVEEKTMVTVESKIIKDNIKIPEYLNMLATH